MYTYKAKIFNIVDGDTYDAIVDLGFNVSITVRLRLDGIDTPETWRPKTEAERKHGEECTAFVRAILENGTVTIHSTYQGAYSRYGATVILPGGRILAEVLRDAGFEKRSSYIDQ